MANSLSSNKTGGSTQNQPFAIMMWNRLEGRPRTHNFDKALKAEVRDALWMITKQWQMGEFQGEDAGSPIFAKVHITSSHLDSYKAANNQSKAFRDNIPLEVRVEQKKIPFKRDGKDMSLDIRLQVGRYWLKVLSKKNLAFSVQYINEYRIELPVKTRENDHIYAHRGVWQQYAAVSGRCMDGYKLYEHIILARNNASDNITNTNAEKTKLDDLGKEFIKWFDQQYYQHPDEHDNAWLADRLEYQFESAGTADFEQKILHAEEYYQGHLDWYAFDIEEKRNSVQGQPKTGITNTFIPAPVKFDGMPDTRWWTFEDGKTSLGDIKPSTTDISKLLLMDFGLVYGNDWFLIPHTVPVGSLVNIKGLTVKNNFGETTWIRSTEGEGIQDLPWSMFKLKSAHQNNTLFLAPAAIKVHEGNPLEEIVLIRDEMSNMVWGIESVVPLYTGAGDKGNEAALRIRQYHEKMVHNNAIPDDISYAARISYLAMTDVPENWIPFIPVHVRHDSRETQLQRASMLRIIDGDPDALAPIKIKPQTSMLREGLDNLKNDGTPDPLPYYIHEEEVPRSGVRVMQSFQRTRWINGEVFVWLGMKKKTGRGEGSSGLKFDQIVDVKE